MITWTCDRCSMTIPDITEVQSNLPEGWLSFGLHRTQHYSDETYTNRELTSVKHLCSHCSTIAEKAKEYAPFIGIRE